MKKSSIFYLIKISIILIIIFINHWSVLAQAKRSTEDWDLLYTHMRQQINKHSIEYPTGKKYLRGLKDYMPYVHALDVFGGDRDQALQYAQEAQAEGNPYYSNKFKDLFDRAQAEGNSVLNLADFLFRLEDERGTGDGWTNWCEKAEWAGKPIYNKAKELHFDKKITQKQVQVLLSASLDDLENGYEYLRSELWPNGKVNPQADKCLSYVEQVRNLAEYFELIKEYRYATDMMNRYLKDALCLLPKGHQWYLDLSNQYNLKNAKKYIEGFYATIYGKVEIETEEGKKSAPGAMVRVYAQEDNQEWKTTANENGEYRMERVILHKDCSPFKISAEYQDDKEVTTYNGPLEDPDPSYEYEKDLLIKIDSWKGTIASTFEMGAQGDQSLVSSVLMYGGKYKGTENWEIDVIFKLNRGNERVKIYKLNSAKIKFQEEVESEIHMQSEHGEVQMDGKDKAQLSGRRLSPSECNLLLIIDLKKKTYKINGTLQVENIPANGYGRLKVDVGPIQNDHQDTDEGITDIIEEILIEGKFSGDEPKVMEGSQDIIKECPPEFQEFMKAVAGKISYKIRWKFSKKDN